MSAPEPVISADSHICEIEACYADIDPKFRDSRPKAIFDEQAGAMLEIADLGMKVPMGLVCTGGRPPEDARTEPGTIWSDFFGRDGGVGRPGRATWRPISRFCLASSSP